MKNDIYKILNEWEFNPDNYIRFIKGENGRELMQVRLPLGIEQYELSGRPDGKKPYGKETILEEYENKLADSQKNKKTFLLTDHDYQLLKNESMLYYYRYLILFQIGEYNKTIKDTDHNIKLYDFIDKYYFNKNKNSLLQYRPYVYRINSISKAMLFINKKDIISAKNILESAIETIKTIPKINTEIFNFEKSRSISQIQDILDQLKSQFPDEKDILQEELKRAIELEDFKWAAELRDKLNKIVKEENRKII